MLRFLLRRLAGSIFVIFVIATASFFLMRLAPGSPFLREDGKAISPEILENMKRHYDMDQPLGVQYIRQMKRIFLHLDFGYAMRKNRSVNELIAEGFPVTLELGCYALLIALSIGIP
ncbi:MAG: ABC transporter permease, partial [Deltaproteobacteria bacterium]